MCVKEDSDGPGMQKFIKGFQLFALKYENKLADTKTMMESISRGENISYGTNDRVYLEIQKFLYKANNDNKDVIRSHLLTIVAIIEPNSSALEDLHLTNKQKKELSAKLGINIDDDSCEGRFVQNLLNVTRSIVSGTAGDISDDPMTSVSNVLSSGEFIGMMSQLQNNVENETMDGAKLYAKMQGAMNEMISEIDDPETKKIIDDTIAMTTASLNAQYGEDDDHDIVEADDSVD